jgi:NADH:ubiquinone oxidoreductase subunit H
MEILRLPFDFYERESELISGFNLELRSFKFILLFIVEYLDMIYFLNLRMLIFFYLSLISFLFLMVLLLIVL